MRYRLLGSGVGSVFLRMALIVFWGACAVSALAILGSFFPDELLALGTLIFYAVGFALVIVFCVILVRFMPNIYIFFVPMKPLMLIALPAALCMVFVRQFIPQWKAEFYPVLAENRTFVVLIVVFGIALAVGVPLLKKLYGAITDKAAFKAEEARLTHMAPTATSVEEATER